jgi:hypothetical protein
MLKLLLAYIRSPQGSIALIFGLSAPALLAAAAVVMDYLLMVSIRSDLQAAADVAAIGSARELSLGGTTTARLEALTLALAQQNLPSASLSGFRIETRVERSAGTVDVMIERTWHPLFLHIFDSTITPIRVAARARALGSERLCVIGLSDQNATAIHLMQDARLTANGCSVYSNAAGTQGLRVDDNARLTAKLICVVGGYRTRGMGTMVPAATTDCPPLPDPLAGRQPPPAGPCDYVDLIIKDKALTLDPGVYCGGLQIIGKARVMLSEGEYIIADGSLRVQGTASLIGRFVGFYLKGAASLIDFDGDTTIDLSAPRAGPMAGLLFFEDRSAPPLRSHHIGSNNARTLLGTIYLPRGQLRIDARAPVADSSAYTALVVRNLELDAGPNLVLNSNYEATAVPVPQGLEAGRVVLEQ